MMTERRKEILLDFCIAYIFERANGLDNYVRALKKIGFSYGETYHELRDNCGLSECDVEDLMSHIYYAVR